MGKYNQINAPPVEEGPPTPASSEDVSGLPRITVSPGGKYNQVAPPDVAGPAPRQRAFNEPFGELKPADPSWTQWLKWKAQDALMGLGMQPYTAGHLGGAAVDIGSMTPMGGVLSAADFTYNASRGNKTAAAIDAIGAIPAVTAARRMIRGTPTTIPAHNPPPQRFMGPEPPQSVAGTPHYQQGFVTPSNVELSGRGPRMGEPLGTAQQGYNAINNSPVRFHPNTGHDIFALATQHIQQPNVGAFTRQKAPLVYDTLENFAQQMAREGRLITPADLDTLRQSLRGLPDANGPAGQRVVDVLDTYMMSPRMHAGRLVQGTPQDLATMRVNFQQARGDYRAGETSKTVEGAIDRAGTRAGATYSGGNVENATRQNMAAFSNTDAGQQRIFGATQPERLGIWQASQGTPMGNFERATGKLLGGGGGMHGANVITGASLLGGGGSYLGGMDPYTAAALGLGAGVGARVVGKAMNRAGAERAVSAAEEAAAAVRRNSPEYHSRLNQIGGAIPDPSVQMRDRMTAALVGASREPVKEWWNEVFVPEYR